MSTERPPSRVRPTEVRKVREQGLVRITWSDGHVGDYPYVYLRGWCPCAVCQGHGSGQRFLDIPRATLERITSVGTYALQFAWEGGHDTGIYSYSYLRLLCPCPSCVAARKADDSAS